MEATTLFMRKLPSALQLHGYISKFILFSSFFCLSSRLAIAQDSLSHQKPPRVVPWFVERFRISAGAFLPVNNTNIQVGVQGGANGTDINFEKDLGFSQAQLTFLANAQWRISSRSRINLNYYNIPRNSTHTLDRDITFRDSTYPVNATVNSFFNTAIYQFSYGYSILSKPTYEVGILIGAHIVGGKAGISLATQSGSASRSTNFGFTAPLPDIGLWGGYSFSNKLAATLDIDYLSLTVNNITGSIFAYNLLVLYRVANKLDLSLGYTGLNFKVTATRQNANGMFKWGYNGPALGVSYSFGKRPWVTAETH
jgi:hypothetical protein